MNKLKPHLLSIAGIAIIVICIFYNVILPPVPLMAQDAPLVSEVLSRQRAKNSENVYWNTAGYLGSGGSVLANKSAKYRIDLAYFKRFVPTNLVSTFNFPFAVLIVGIGFYMFALSLNLKPLSAFTGAASIMLAGHFISCIYSGHTGKFFMLAYLCLALWLLTTGIRKRSILCLLWSGVCGGLGVSNALDVGFIVIIFFAVWMVFLIYQTRNQKRWLKLSSGLVIACAAGLLYSASTIYSLAGLSKSESGSPTAKDNRSEAEKWNWATQWSLPKIETITFVMPGFFGFGLPESPYWGSIGCDARWETQHVGFPRFSMSTQNMGIVVIALVLLAIITASTRKKHSKSTIYFWTVSMILALLFAYGRYFDFGGTSAGGFGPYRIFYWLPQMDSMRNPVKFLYPFMISLSILAAFGMEYVLGNQKSST